MEENTKTAQNNTPAIPANIMEGLKLTYGSVKSALEAWESAYAEREERLAMVQKMQAELDADEAALDYMNLKAVAAIQTRKAQMLGLQAQSAKVDLEDTTSKQGILDAIRNAFSNAWLNALRTHMMGEVEKVLSPLFADKSQLHEIAETADCVITLRDFVATITSCYKLDTCDDSARVITSHLERLFNGENVFLLPNWTKQ